MIEKYIKELLINHDKVVVPGLGTFTASYSASEVADNTLTPPRKVLSFSEFEADDGELFRNAVIKGENISKDIFNDDLRAFVEGVKTQIAVFGKYEIEGVGTFSRDDNGTLVFRQSEDQNFLSDSFGLPKIPHKRLNKNTNEDDQQTAQGTTMTQDEEEEKKKSSDLVWWLVVIPLVFIFAFLIYLFTYKDAMDKFKAFFSGSEPVIAQQDTQPAGDQTPAATPDNSADRANNGATQGTQDQQQTTPDNAGTTRNEVADNTPASKPAATEDTPKRGGKKARQTTPARSREGFVTASPTGRYYIIYGSYANEQVAQQTSTKLSQQGYEVSIIPYEAKNMYRVTIGDFATEREAYNRRNELNTKFDNSQMWVLKY